MKLITSLLVLYLALTAGTALAQTDAGGNTDNMSGMNNMTGNMTCSVSGIMTLIPETMGNMTGMDNMTGSQEGSNMKGMGDMTGAKTYSIIATVDCMPGAMINMTERAQAGNMTENMTGMDNITGMDNMTETKICHITGNATSIPEDMTLAENMTVDNMTGSQNYSIIATVKCMPNVTKGAQAGNMTENMTGMNTTGVRKFDINGTMTLIPANMTPDGNMTEMGNIPGAKTYSISATVECMPVVMSNMTEGDKAGNMTENMTDIDNMTKIKMCFIAGNATSLPANLTQVENMTVANMTDTGNMTGSQNYSIIATVDCMPGVMANMTEGAQAGNMTENMTGNQTESMAENQTGM
jgi:hypothetical protein